MRYFEAALILLLSNHLMFASSNRCGNNAASCRCFNNTNGEYEIRCSSSNDNEVEIRTKPDKAMLIQCLGKQFDVDIFPNYTPGGIIDLEISLCPLSPDDLFSVLEKFDIETLEKLTLNDVSISEALFEDLSSLRTLQISRSRSPSTLDVDAFQNLPNLRTLYLDNNNINGIDGQFQNLKYLKVLHLSRNYLTDIPDATFQNLTDLQQLHLLKNKLTRIERSYFSDLRNLKSLELSCNYIQYIEKDAFSDLSELVNISLSGNQLGHISSDIFRQKGKLHSIKMDHNFNVTLDDYAFANLTNLSIVDLAQSGLQNIPAHVFDGSENIKILKMQNNWLQDLPEVVFSGLKQLKELYLTGNNIFSIPDELFSPLANLEILELAGNQIFEINDNVLKTIKNLKKLHLNNNRIHKIAFDAFANQENLIFMDFSNNLYDRKNDGEYPFNKCTKLEQLILSGNGIDEFPSNIMLMGHLTKLNLSHNNIQEIMVSELKKLSGKEITIDLSDNRISQLDFRITEATGNEHMPVTTVLLSNNALHCNCMIYDLIRYIRDEMDPKVKMRLDLRVGNDSCAFRDQKRKIKDLRLQDVTCPPYFTCNSSSDCPCFYRPFDKTIVVDCSDRNLDECPRIEVESGKVELNLTGNRIRHGPNSSLGYNNVTNLLLSNNWIEQFKWMPPRTEILKLDGNRLKNLDLEVLKIMNSTSVLKLSNNPWTCDCSAFDFQNFIRAKFGKESKDIVCEEDNKPLIEKNQLCEPISNLIMQIVIPISVFVVSIAVGTALFFYYETEIKIWLFGVEWLCWPVPETELDKNKKFDIFLSYSNEDEEFVVRNLLPLLEEGPDPFRICIHIRDWKAGEPVTKQIAESVYDSRRTMVVLSNNFLKSVWGKMEFVTAHTRAMEEKTARVIIIKYGELDEEKLDEELKMYLKTNTYLEWGEPWFLNKLRYALPHFRSRNMIKNQKHVDVMMKIDDEYKSTCPPLVHPKSTTSVMGSDPGMLKSSPLNFERSSNPETPSVETPLVIEGE